MPDQPGGSLDHSELAAVFRHFADHRCGSYAPLYATLGAGIAADPALLAIAAHAGAGHSPPDLMLAAVHYLLAGNPGDPLARHYPSLTADPADGDPVPLFRDFCRRHRDPLVELVSARQVQTNEVRRCTFLLPAVALAAAMAGRPLALIEPGASAGLNLAMDQYAYDYGTGTAIGGPDPALTLTCTLNGPRQPPLSIPMPEIRWRAGIDLSPLSPADPGDAAWLQALVWPDHRDRAALLRSALTAAATRPPIPVHAGDATLQLPDVIAAAPPGTAVCLFHTAFLAHFTPAGRQQFEQLVPQLSATRPIWWVQAEPRPDPAEPRLRLSLCEAGRVAREWPLGHYQPHGQWLEWTGPATLPEPAVTRG
jgi:hypothetical protein